MTWEWRRKAACKDLDTELFFDDDQVPAALAVCAGCSVRQACLEDALEVPASQDFGIFGGTTPKIRRAMRTNTGVSPRGTLTA